MMSSLWTKFLFGAVEMHFSLFNTHLMALLPRAFRAVEQAKAMSLRCSLHELRLVTPEAALLTLRAPLQ